VVVFLDGEGPEAALPDVPADAVAQVVAADLRVNSQCIQAARSSSPTGQSTRWTGLGIRQ
jgi:hypothetical protein